MRSNINKSTPKHRTVNLSGCSSETELASFFITQLKLLDLYEHNIDGLASHFFYRSNDGIPKKLTVEGYSIINHKIPTIASKFSELLHEFEAQNSWFEYELL
jgi:hypothetical protein